MNIKRLSIIFSLCIVSAGFLVCLLIYILFFYDTQQRKGNYEVARILGLSKVTVLSSDYSYDPFVIRDYDIIEVYQLSCNSIHDFVSCSSLKGKIKNLFLQSPFNGLNNPILGFWSLPMNRPAPVFLVGMTFDLRVLEFQEISHFGQHLIG